MRRSLAFLLPLSLLGLATFACEDSASVEGTTLNLDGGSPDVSIPPIAIDGAAEASTPTVTVAVQGSAAAKANVEIVFEYADGTLEAKKTGADGLATSTGAETPKQVTALVGSGEYFTAKTWLGVAGGDVLAVRGFDATSGTVGIYKSSTVAAPTGTVGQRVSVSSQCRGFESGLNAAAIDVTVYDQCVPPSGKPTLLAVAEGATSGEDKGYAFLKGQALPAAAGTNVTFGSWIAPGSLAIAASHVPTDGFVTATTLEIADGLPFHVQFPLFDSVQNTSSFKIAPGFADAYQVTLSRDIDANHAQDVIVRQTGTATMAVDFGAALPTLGEPKVTGDPQQPDFTWTGDTTSLKGGVLVFGYEGAGAGGYNWTVIVSPGTTTVKFPKLPDDAAAFRPKTGTTLANYIPELAFVDGAALSASSFRALVGGYVDLGYYGLAQVVHSTPMPESGTYRVTSWHQPPS